MKGARMKNIKSSLLVWMIIVCIMHCHRIHGQNLPGMQEKQTAVGVTLEGPSHLKATDAGKTVYTIRITNLQDRSVIVCTMNAHVVLYDNKGNEVSDLKRYKNWQFLNGSFIHGPSLYDLVILQAKGDVHEIHRPILNKFLRQPKPGNYFLQCVIYPVDGKFNKDLIFSKRFLQLYSLPLTRQVLYSSPRLPIQLD